MKNFEHFFRNFGKKGKWFFFDYEGAVGRKSKKKIFFGNLRFSYQRRGKMWNKNLKKKKLFFPGKDN